MTKRELLARIRRGPASVELLSGTRSYRIALPEDRISGVWISLSAEHGYAVEDYTTVRAKVGGRPVRLRWTESDSIATFVAATMKMRQQLRP